MGKLIRISITIIFLIIIATTSILVHEGVHYIQAKMDPRVDPIGLRFLSNTSYNFLPDFTSPGIALISEWEDGVSDDEKAQWVSESIYREKQAYAVQIIYVILIMFFLMRKDLIF